MAAGGGVLSQRKVKTAARERAQTLVDANRIS